jgi:hypothetical protein
MYGRREEKLFLAKEDARLRLKTRNYLKSGK